MLVIAQLRLLFVPTVKADENPVLTSVSISFHKKDDDKDHDTLLSMSLEKGLDEFANVVGITGTVSGPFGQRPLRAKYFWNCPAV